MTQPKPPLKAAKKKPAKAAARPVKATPATVTKEEDVDIAALGALDSNFDQEPRAERRIWWIVLTVIGILLFSAGAVVALNHNLVGAELAVFRAINDWPESLRPLFLLITTAPESLWIAVVVVLASFILKLYRVAWQLAAATVAGYAVTFIAKEVIGRERPMNLIHDVHVRVHETSMGYPSGHTMIMTVAVLALWPYLPKGWRWGIALLIPLMGLSRIYLGVHSPLDVVGGFAVGAVVVGVMRILPAAMRRFFRFD